jgi:hypothetical protein
MRRHYARRLGWRSPQLSLADALRRLPRRLRCRRRRRRAALPRRRPRQPQPSRLVLRRGSPVTRSFSRRFQSSSRASIPSAHRRGSPHAAKSVCTRTDTTEPAATTSTRRARSALRRRATTTARAESSMGARHGARRCLPLPAAGPLAASPGGHRGRVARHSPSSPFGPKPGGAPLSSRFYPTCAMPRSPRGARGWSTNTPRRTCSTASRAS